MRSQALTFDFEDEDGERLSRVFYAKNHATAHNYAAAWAQRMGFRILL